MNTPRRSIPTVLGVFTAIASAVVVTACGPEDADLANPAPIVDVATAVPVTAPRPQTVAEREAPPVQRHLGRITAIEPVRGEGRTSGAGAAIGGVAGGVVGHQIGDGTGRTVATVAGAVGGALAGNHIEKRRKEPVVSHRVSVRMDNGDTRTVTVDSGDGLNVGDRVRVEGEHLIRL